MNKFVRLIAEKRLFLIANNQLYKVAETGLELVKKDEFKQVHFPVLIVGHEHLSERVHSFPVVDQQDVKQIIKNNLSAHSIVGSAEISEHTTSVKTWQLDDLSSALIESKACCWIPELWLLKHISEDNLIKLKRAGSEIWFFVRDKAVDAIKASGLMSQKHNFLMSLGVTFEYDEVVFDEAAYSAGILAAVCKLSSRETISILRIQNYQKRLLEKFSWLSWVTGAVTGVLVFNLAYVGFMNVQIGRIGNDIEQQDVGRIIAKQKQFDNLYELQQNIQSATSSEGNELVLWSLLATLMENNITILRVTSELGVLQIRAESKVAADALQLLNDQDIVKSAKFSTAVRKSRGNERYTMEVTLAES